MNNFAVFVSSSDDYSDIWDLFFDLFCDYWPEYINGGGKIYLQTQTKEYNHPSLNIFCTKVGKLKYYGEMLRAGLDKVQEDNILFVMIDYIFMGKVDNQKLICYYDFFTLNDVDSLRLVEERFNNYRDTSNPDIKQCFPPAPNRFFSYQIAFWRKEKLREIVLPHESPWSSEWYGDKRAHEIPLKLYSIKENIPRPILYDLRGCLHRGKWLDIAVDFLERINYKIDFSRRGYYTDEYNSIRTRLKLSYRLKLDGLKGSWLDLLKRKMQNEKNFHNTNKTTPVE